MPTTTFFIILRFLSSRSSFHRAGAQSPHHLVLCKGEENPRRDAHEDGGGHQRPPVYAHLVYKKCQSHGNRAHGLAVRHGQGKQEFVPGQDKRVHGGEKSYTRYLFMSGQDKILKKVGEEAAETIIASKNNNGKEVLYEMSDLWYHCLVLLAYHNINPAELLNELGGRRSKENNSKY